jgi:dextranase
MPFDGLHIDQYGDPKHAWDSNHQPVDLPSSFVDFIQSASDLHPDQTILFNAVGNWPIEALADSAVDFMYIEIWPPDVEYRQLAKIVLDAVRLSHGRAVVIALYLPTDRPTNNLLADAVILACGGTRIELGEDARLLSDPYFPKHEEMSLDLYLHLRQLADFTVRNGEWMRPYALCSTERQRWADADLNPDFVITDDSLWAVARQYPGLLVVQLLNFNGLDLHQRWNESHASPVLFQNSTIKIQMRQGPSKILWDCPEQTRGPLPLGFEYSNGTLTVQIPNINFIGLVAIYE